MFQNVWVPYTLLHNLVCSWKSRFLFFYFTLKQSYYYGVHFLLLLLPRWWAGWFAVNSFILQDAIQYCRHVISKDEYVKLMYRSVFAFLGWHYSYYIKIMARNDFCFIRFFFWRKFFNVAMWTQARMLITFTAGVWIYRTQWRIQSGKKGLSQTARFSYHVSV